MNSSDKMSEWMSSCKGRLCVTYDRSSPNLTPEIFLLVQYLSNMVNCICPDWPNVFLNASLQYLSHALEKGLKFFIFLRAGCRRVGGGLSEMTNECLLAMQSRDGNSPSPRVMWSFFQTLDLSSLTSWFGSFPFSCSGNGLIKVCATSSTVQHPSFFLGSKAHCPTQKVKCPWPKVLDPGSRVQGPRFCRPIHITQTPGPIDPMWQDLGSLAGSETQT